ncbi:hypothetical protein IG631_17654 [Alternaria alternata]|nr:hypothetical protein IG631_17654 [Alternaria alternata]
MPERMRQTENCAKLGSSSALLRVPFCVDCKVCPMSHAPPCPHPGLISAILVTVQNELLRFFSCNRSHRRVTQP